MATASAPARSTPHVLVVPFPTQGHALPLLDLAAVLAARGVRLTVVTTPANTALLSPLLAAHPAYVQPLVLPLPAHPSLPPGFENNKSCPPTVVIHALAALHQPILAWARSQSAAAGHPVVAVLSDFFCGWTQPLAAELGVPRLVFSPSGVLGTAVTHSIFRRLVKKRPSEADDSYVLTFPAIPGEPSYRWGELLRMYKAYVEGRMEEQVGEAVRQNFLWNLESWGFVSNTLHALEGRYLDAPLEDLGFKRVWAVGPLAPETDSGGERGGEASAAAGDLGAWLDTFQEGSVMYVCFGSQMGLKPAMAAALAEALERSAVPFVWAVGGTALPEGFEGRAVAAKRGLVVRGWAPQLAILRHAAVGWFMTHCGWNSMLEALAAGVPMLAWPMAAEQFVNARLLVDEARVAVRACAGGLGGPPDAGELAAVLADTIGEGGAGVRARAREFAAKSAGATKEGGSSHEDLNSLVEEIQKL